MSRKSHSEASRRQQWVDDLLAHVQEQEDRQDSSSAISDIDEDNDGQSQLALSLMEFLENLENISSSKQTTPRAELEPQAIKPGASEMSPFSKGDEEEKHLDFINSLKSNFDAIKSHHQQIRIEYLEEVCEKFGKKGHLGFLKEMTSTIGEANVLLDCQMVHDLQMNDRLRAPVASVGFHAIYALNPSVYWRHINAAPAEIVQVINFRADLGHHGRYKHIVRRDSMWALKVQCYKIISLWKKHVDLIQDYPDNEDEAKSTQLADYPTEEIGAEIAKLEEMRRSWEAIQIAVRSAHTQTHGLLGYWLARNDQGEIDVDLYRRLLLPFFAMTVAALVLDHVFTH